MNYRELNIPAEELEINSGIFPSVPFILRYYLAEEGIEELMNIQIDSANTESMIFLYESGSNPGPRTARYIRYPVVTVKIKYYNHTEDRDPREVADMVVDSLDSIRNIRYKNYLIKNCFVESELEFFEQQDTSLVYKTIYYVTLIDLKKQAEAHGYEYIPSKLELKEQENGS
ncbi:hypothetical protein MHB40_20485 [Lysinibacillus sp. FSL K6-0057]|uniref:hypothetical protein n=1 Tax=Lysinibacillus sp. FSL K6-0057 TaxID=2921411 RepID=UPI00315AEA39